MYPDTPIYQGSYWEELLKHYRQDAFLVCQILLQSECRQETICYQDMAKKCPRHLSELFLASKFTKCVFKANGHFRNAPDGF